jgi:uncharacterized membrane protein YccF (DUF307 family)
VPEDIAVAVRDRQRRDNIQTAELISRGTPTTPVTTGVDGGMNPIFLAAMKSHGGPGATIRTASLIGLFPVVGDIITTALSLFNGRQCSSRRRVRRGATGRRRLRRVVAREPAKRAAVTGVAGPRASAVSRVVIGRRVAMSVISLLLNLLWIVFGGLWMALGWVIAAIVMAITIVGLPWARAAFSIAAYTLLPFGYKAVPRDEYFGREDIGTGPLGVVGNIVWLLLAGWWLALGHLVTAILLAVTIVGIPFAWAHLKLAGLALWPIGKAIVPAQNAPLQ